jgi:hypothetical protein
MTNDNDPAQTPKHVPTVEVTVKYLHALRQAHQSGDGGGFLDLCADTRSLW